MYNYGNKVDSGGAVSSPNLMLCPNVSGEASKYKIIERIDGHEDVDLFNAVDWHSLSQGQIDSGAIPYKLTSPDVYGDVQLGFVVSSSGRVSNSLFFSFYYGNIASDIVFNGFIINTGEPVTYNRAITIHTQTSNQLPTKYCVTESIPIESELVWLDYTGPISHQIATANYGNTVIYLSLKGMVEGVEVLLPCKGQPYASASILYSKDVSKKTEINIQIPMSVLGVSSIDSLTVDIPLYKYSKAFALSTQVDDSLNFYASNVFNYIWGRPFSLASDVGTGVLGFEDSLLPSYSTGFTAISGPTLNATDGCGVPIPFRTGIAFNQLATQYTESITSESSIDSRLKDYSAIPALSGMDLASTDTNWGDGTTLHKLTDAGYFKSAAINAFKSSTVSSGLPYPAYTTLSDLGFGISNHGGTTEAIDSIIPTASFLYCLTGSTGGYSHNSAVLTWDIAGRWPHSIIIPGGNSAIMAKFLKYDCFYFYTAANDMSTGAASSYVGLSQIYKPFTTTGESSSTITYPALYKSFKCRVFPSNTPKESWAGYVNEARAKAGWLIQSSHSVTDGITSAFYKKFIGDIYASYGAAGDDSVWMASQEEVFEYLYTSKATAPTLKLTQVGSMLSISMQATELSEFNFNELSLRLFGAPSTSIQRTDVIDAGGSLHTLNCSSKGDHILLNIGWDKNQSQRASKWLGTYLKANAAQPGSDRASICKQYYEYLYSILKPGDYKNRLNAIYNDTSLPSTLGSISIVEQSPVYNTTITVLTNIEGEATPASYMISEDESFVGAVVQPYTSSLVSYQLSDVVGLHTVYCKALLQSGWTTPKSASITYAVAPSEIITRLSVGYGRGGVDPKITFDGVVNRLLILTNDGVGYGATINSPLAMRDNLGVISGYLTSCSSDAALDSVSVTDAGKIPAEVGVYSNADFTYNIRWNGGYEPRSGQMKFTSMTPGKYDVRLYCSTALAGVLTATMNTTNIVASGTSTFVQDATASPYANNTNWVTIPNVTIGADGTVLLNLWTRTVSHAAVFVNIIEFNKIIQ